jgi:predicted Zn-dependent peptidase
MSYADSVLFHNQVLTPDEELDKIKRVTLEDIKQVANEIFSNDKLNLALIGPFKDDSEFKAVLKI